MRKEILKKTLGILLVASMTLSMVACGSKQEQSKTSSESTKKTSSAQSEAESTSTEKEKEHVTIKWVTKMAKEMPGGDAVEAAVNEYLKEKLNMTLDITFVAQSEYDQKINTIISSGSDWDLATAGTTMFVSNANRNAFLSLNDYIEEYLPTPKAKLPQAAWDAYTVKGQVYAVPPVKDLAENWSYIANQSLLDDLQIEFPVEKFYTGFDMNDFYYELKEARDKKYPQYENCKMATIQTVLNFWYFFDPLIGSWNTTLVATNVDGLEEYGFSDVEDTDTVFCPYYTEDIRTWGKTMLQGIKDGIYAGEGSIDNEKLKAELGFTITGGDVTVGAVEIDPARFPYFDSELYLAQEGMMYTSGVQVGGLVVNADCEYPDRVLELVELLYSDEWLATTLHFGIEGQDWTDNDNDGVIEIGERNSDGKNRYWYNWYGWWLGDITSTKSAPGCSSEFEDKLLAVNENSAYSQNMGFLADTTNIANEVAACNNVVAEYMTQLTKLTGSEDIDKLCDEFEAKLKANGMDTIIKEVQSQLDAWKAENNK